MTKNEQYCTKNENFVHCIFVCKSYNESRVHICAQNEIQQNTWRINQWKN